MKVASAIVSVVLLVTATGRSSADPGDRLSRGHASHLAWSRSIDGTGTLASDNAVPIAYGSGVVVFSSAGKICAYAERSGAQRWCHYGRATSIAYARNQIAYASDGGSVTGVAAADGAPLWSVLPAGGSGRATNAERDGVAQVVWGANGHLLIARLDGGVSPGAANYGEIGAAGRLVWSAPLLGSLQAPVVRPPYVFQGVSGVGGGFSSSLAVFRLGRAGGAVSAIGGVAGFLATDGNVVFGRGAQSLTPDPVLVFDIVRATIRDARVSETLHLAPDAEGNRELLEQGKLDALQGRVAVELPYAYVGVGNRTYRYDLSQKPVRRPLLLSTNGVFVGGPAHGAVFVRSTAGVSMIRTRATRTETTIIARSISSLRTFVIIDRSAYLSFDDGRFVRASIDTGFPSIDEKACAANRIFASAAMIYLLCSGPTPRVMALMAPTSLVLHKRGSSKPTSQKNCE